MIPLSEIEWGPIDAADPDDSFFEKFIEPIEITSLLAKDIYLIAGEKGSGKTAFCKGVELKHADRFQGRTTIKFDELEFSAIVKALSELASLTSIDRFTFLANYWQYVLVINAIKEYFSRHSINLSLRETRINNYLIKHGLIERNALGLILYLVGQSWDIVSRLTDPKKLKDARLEVMPSNLEPQVLETLTKYPIFDPEFSEIQNDFASVLRDRNETILVTLDGLDRLNTRSDDAKKENLQIIFDGLSQAVYDLSISERFKNVLMIKCMMPYDRYLGLNLRDLDKLTAKCKVLLWSYESLQEFLAKRIALHPRCRHLSSFRQLWGEVMPEELDNNQYQVRESTFDYILRHTMYRPRHLQLHLRALALKYPGQIISPSMIGPSIRESSKQITMTYIKEYEVDHPNLEGYLRKLKGQRNVMPYKNFRRHTSDMLKHFDVKCDVDTKIDMLYRMNFFGQIVFLDDDHADLGSHGYIPPRKHGVSKYRVDFYHREPKIAVTSELRDDDLVAIHPVLFDFGRQTPHKEYVIG